MNEIPRGSSFLHLPYCEGTNTFADRVFLTGNEKNREAVLTKLASEKLQGNAFLGTSCFYSLDAFSKRGTATDSNQDLRYLFIVDRSLRVEAFWKAAEPLIQKAATRAELILAIKDLIEKNKDIYFAKPWGTLTPERTAEHEIVNFQADIDEGISWLSDDIRFNRVQKVFKDCCFFFLRQDFCNPEAMASLSKQFDVKDIVLDTVYCSNIFECCSSYEEEDHFLDSATALVKRKTLVIDAEPREFRHMGALNQRVSTPDTTPLRQLYPHYFSPPKTEYGSDSDGFSTFKASDFTDSDPTD